MGNNNSAIVLHIVNGSVTQQSTLEASLPRPTLLRALSPTDVWVTFSQGHFGLYHYDGQTWTQAHLSRPSEYAGGQSAVSRDVPDALAIAGLGYRVLYARLLGDQRGCHHRSSIAMMGPPGVSSQRRRPRRSAATAPTGNGYQRYPDSPAYPRRPVVMSGRRAISSTKTRTAISSSTTGYIYHRVAWRLAPGANAARR